MREHRRRGSSLPRVRPRAGAFMTTDGVTWQRLLDTGAIRGLPTQLRAALRRDPTAASTGVR